MKDLRGMKIVMPNLIEAGIGRATLQYASWALLCEKVSEVNALLDKAIKLNGYHLGKAYVEGEGFFIPLPEEDSVEKIVKDLARADAPIGSLLSRFQDRALKLRRMNSAKD